MLKKILPGQCQFVKTIRIAMVIIFFTIALFPGGTPLASTTAHAAGPNQDDQPPMPAPSVSDTTYFTKKTVTGKNGSSLDEYIINGPPKPPSGYEAERRPVTLQENDSLMVQSMLPVPAFSWSFGCSATSGAMIAAYYDRNGYANMYTGPTNGGMMPMDDSIWPSWTDGAGVLYAQCPLTASHQGLDGRSTRGSIDDYWVAYNSAAKDPYITNVWTQHAWGDAIGDYMRTSQSGFQNPDGSTSFFNWTSSSTPLTCADMEANGITRDGTYGRKLFYEAKGYNVTDCYNQKTNNNGGAYTFAMYKAEIDAGRPVMVNLQGHTVVGVGYDDSTNTIYIHDTWDYVTHSMVWGGSYSGMKMLSVSIVNFTNAPGFFAKSAPANGTTGVGDYQTLSWGTSVGATSYDYCYDYTNDNACSSWTPYGTSTSVNVGPLDNNTSYYWQVRAHNAAGTTYANGSITNFWSFTTAPCYSLNLGIDPIDSGSVTVNPTPNCSGGTMYTPGTSVSLTANPANGYAFSNWTGDISGPQNPLTFTMDGIKNETAIFTSAAVPTITNFTPVSGPVGTLVTITGTNFTGATFVKFNGVSATYSNVSASSIIATVPAGATTGLISIATPNGTATSASNFTVTTAAPITLFAKPAATGNADCHSWANACSLQTALNTAVDGDEIWVMQGTHKPSATGVRTATFQLKSGVGVYGGFLGTETLRSQRNPTINVTTLSGDLNGNDNTNIKSDEPTRAENSYHVVTGSGTDSTASLDGFTVTGGNAEMEQGCPGTGCGGGMENAGGSPTLANIIFAGNAVYLNGGAMSNTGGSNPTLTNVTFNNNTALVSAGGAMFNHTSNPSLMNVVFSNNWCFDRGGAIYNHASSPTLTNVTFANNSSYHEAGAIYNWSSSNPTLTNATFAGNSAQWGGSLVNTYGCNATIRNSILWGNPSLNVYNNLGSATIENSVVEGGCPSGSTCSNIITDDPLLGVFGSYGGSTQTVPLLPGSPAINFGSTDDCSSKDQRGQTRVGTCDIGAFESQGFTLAITGGSNQTALLNAPFASPLQVSVTANDAGELVNGGIITFTAPASGASVTMPTQKITVTNGSASVNQTANGTLGLYQVSAAATGANTVNFNLTNGSKLNTTIQLTSAPNPSILGQSVLLTANVTAAEGTPTGSVTFYDNGANLGSGSLNASGAATLSISTLSIGTHSTITAQYAGDANYNASSSTNYSHIVNKASTTTSVTSTQNPSTFGQSVTFTATVSITGPGEGTPAGTVTFYDGEAVIGTTTLNTSGMATLETSMLAAGSHAITAQYSGDASFTGSTSGIHIQTVWLTVYLPLIVK